MPDALALSEHLAGIALFTTPMQLAGLGALTAYNIALILSFALSGFFMYLLARHLIALQGETRRTVIVWGAICAGVAYGFAPYRASQLAHLQVLTSQWMPLALLAMHSYLDDGRRRWLVLFGAAWVIQALSNGYYLLFFPVLVALWLAWFVDWRSAWRRGLALAAAWAGSSLLLVPTLLRYREVHDTLGLARSLDEMRMFSASLASFAHAGRLLAFWPHTDIPTQEGFLFPGVTAVLLVAAAAALALRRAPRFRRSPFAFYVLAMLGMWWLALGPAPDGSATGPLTHPYTLLTYLPGFEGLRVPARFAMMGYLCLAAAAAIAFARLAPSRGALQAFFGACVLAGLAVDGWMERTPLAPPPSRVLLPDVKDAIVLELPANDDRINTAAMYRSIQHGYPLVNGYSGHTPAHFGIAAEALRRGDPTTLTELARLGSLLVLIHNAQDPHEDLRRMVETVPGVEPLATTNVGRLYRVPRQAAAVRPPLEYRTPAFVREVSFERVIVDLGEPRVVRTVNLPIGRGFRRIGEKIEIEGSLDGGTWRTLWLDWTGGVALRGALEDPRAVPMRFPIADARVRYLRIHPVQQWLQGGIEVYGPD